MRSKLGFVSVPSVSVGITLAALLALCTIGATAQAATYYWDPAANPWPAAAEHGTTQPRIGPLLHRCATTTYPSSGTTNQAEFYGSSGTVGVYSTQNLQALLFDAGTSYTLTPTGSPLSVLNFNNTASTIGVAGSGVINVPISTVASTTLTITGVSSGKLTLGGASTFALLPAWR